MITKEQIKKYAPRVLIAIILLFSVATCYDSTTTSSKLTKLQKEQSQVELKYQLAVEKEKAWLLQKEKFEKENDSLINVNKKIATENKKLDADIASLEKTNSQNKKRHLGQDYDYFANLLALRYEAPESVESTTEGVTIKNDVPRFIADDLDDLDTNVNVIAKLKQSLENEKTINRNLLIVQKNKDDEITSLEATKKSLMDDYAKAVKAGTDNLNEADKQSKRKNTYKWLIPAAFVAGVLIAK